MALVSYENSDTESENDSLIETNNKVLQKSKVKKCVKIEIPHLSNFDDVEEPSKKVFIATKKNVSSGLFKILPPLKYKPEEKTYKFDATIVNQKNLVPRTIKTANKNDLDDKEEDEISKGNYFFSTYPKSKTINVGNSSVPLNIKVDSAKSTQKTNAYFSNLVSSTIEKNVVKPKDYETSTVMDDNVIDLNSSEFKNNWKMNVLKEVSSTTSTSQENEDEPSSLSKRKHQITYLAYQAKKNEEQFKIQWAMNRMTRRQTQAKYGF